MSGVTDILNPASMFKSPLLNAVGIKTSRAADDPEHWKRQRDAEEARTKQLLAEQRVRHEEELARPANVLARARATASTLGESGKRTKASQYLSGS